MPFEWDSKKREINLQKHGVDFCTVANDFEACLFEGPSGKNEEERFIRYVQSGNDEVFFVVYTLRGDNIRIISARKAGRDERRRLDNL
jgi:uncharacterized DUF497 family protein